ncbi:ABC transporter ATP-binding protein [Rudaea sp.]|uniref:ABC transporter ATP-binding protein n=1 Tax=Rudaea sp. TaxID=2136325 RepID=UPI0037842899
MGEEVVTALEDVDLIVHRNEYVALTGPSGSGKSTLMGILGCLDTASSGAYLLNGKSTAQMSEGELAHHRNTNIGFVFQSFHLIPRYTILQNVMQPLVYRRIRASVREQMAREALERVGLSNRLNHRPNEISGGQKQRVAIARALVGNPSLLLADEPTGNLDSKTTLEIMVLLEELHASGQTVVIVTHEPDIAARCRRVVRIRDGRIATDNAFRLGQ